MLFTHYLAGGLHVVLQNIYLICFLEEFWNDENQEVKTKSLTKLKSNHWTNTQIKT